MSHLTLGLDVGARSVGWALINEASKRIVAGGARVFPEGVDRDQQGGEKSKSRARRDARSIRRQIARRANRKHQLVESLTAAGLLPNDADQLNTVLAINPYELRCCALDHKLELHKLGRILIHLNQRRGFLSNRKADKKREDTKGILAEMNQLASHIAESGSRTLGEYLARLHESHDHTSPSSSDKVRGWHTRRDMYQHEFEAIWQAQSAHFPDVLTPELKDRLCRIMFFQRKMYWPKSVVGRCELERKEKRCPRADRRAQRFRILQEVNNLCFLDRGSGQERRLHPEEREKLIAYLAEAKERKFDDIRKKLGFGEWVRFNLEGPERIKLQGHETDAALGGRKGIGKRWKELPATVKDAIVSILIDEQREDIALQRLADEGELIRDEAERALAVNLPDGYMSYSRRAIEKLLPHLERGLLLMADDASNSALHAAGYLRPDEREVNQRDYLPPVPDLPNPIVRQALVEVRKVVNAVLREYVYRDGQNLAEIHVELAREAKRSFQERQQMRFDNADRRRAREEAREEINQHDPSINPTRRVVDRYLLWQEQDHTCVYCGQKISQAQLFGADADTDHILPRWRSLDNSLANKVVCHRWCNSGPTGKGDRTPREWLEDTDPQRYEMVLRIAEKLPYNKQRKFQQKDIVLDHFVQRQLRDTAYISRCVSQYLRCLGARVICPRGQMTAELRHLWGLDKVLDPEGSGEKNRGDHRHHAIDAIVLAFTNDKRLHALANARGKNLDPPWKEGFHQDVTNAMGRILVSHRSQSRLHGALHEATFYGRTVKAAAEPVPPGSTGRPWAKGWIEDLKTFVRRKPLTDLTSTVHLEKVRDASIREVLRQHLTRLGIDPDKRSKIPAGAFTGANTPRMASGVPIKRVRMLEESETFRPVSARRSFQYVKPGNNHHIVYRVIQVKGTAQWSGEVVTMWEAALRARNHKPIVDSSDRPGQEFVMSLSIGEMFEMDGKDGQSLLCVVRKIDQRSKRVYYKLHIDAREAKELDKENLYLTAANLQKRNARKVTVDPLGRQRRAK